MSVLENLIDQTIAKEKQLFLDYNKPNYDQEFICLQLIYSHASLAIYNFSNEPDVENFKQSFYDCALLKLFSYENFEKPGFYGSSNLFLTSHGFIYSVLSDSDDILSRYSQYDDNFLKTYSSSLCKSIKAVYLDDKQMLSLEIEKLYKYTSKKGVIKHYGGIPKALEGILNNDKSLSMEGISSFLGTHKKQDHLIGLVKDYISLETLAILKLAYRNGLIIDFDHHLVPKELIPVVPLEKYEKYAFFDKD